MLTSLLDMFTIILIFLIVSFEAENQEFRLSDGLELPESSARAPFRPAVNLAVTQDAVFMESQRVAPLPDTGDDVPELVTRLEEEYQARFGNPDRPPVTAEVEEGGPMVLIQADRGLEYEALYRVLRSAAQAGFFRYRLAVMKR
jgi:biopolymer transport protein ExbD